jgi:hypothetical protein
MTAGEALIASCDWGLPNSGMAIAAFCNRASPRDCPNRTIFSGLAYLKASGEAHLLGPQSSLPHDLPAMRRRVPLFGPFYCDHFSARPRIRGAEY